MQRAMDLTSWSLLIVLAIVWGGSFFFQKLAVAELAPLVVVLARVVIAAVALWLLVAALRVPVVRRVGYWRDVAVMGLLNNIIPFSLIVWAQTSIDSGLAAVLNATTPLWTVSLAHYLSPGDRATRTAGVGVLIGFVGAVVTIGPAVLTGLGAQALPQLAVLAAAAIYACAGLWGRRLREAPALLTATGQVSASAILLAPVVLLSGALPAALPSPTALGAMLGLALLSTALAYVIYFQLLARAGATNLLLVTFLIPISALFLGVTFLAERLEPRQIAGVALIATGLVFVDGRLPTRAVARLRGRSPASA